jgi:hypothetical protein
MATFMAGVAVAGLAVRGRARRDGGAIRIPVTAAAAVDPTDGDVWRAMTTRAWSPITRLRAAILVQALADLRAPPDTKVGAEVRTWFASEDFGDPCAFVPLCETLGLDPATVRSRVLQEPPGGRQCRPRRLWGTGGGLRGGRRRRGRRAAGQAGTAAVWPPPPIAAPGP